MFTLSSALFLLTIPSTFPTFSSTTDICVGRACAHHRSGPGYGPRQRHQGIPLWGLQLPDQARRIRRGMCPCLCFFLWLSLIQASIFFRFLLTLSHQLTICLPHFPLSFPLPTSPPHPPSRRTTPRAATSRP